VLASSRMRAVFAEALLYPSCDCDRRVRAGPALTRFHGGVTHLRVAPCMRMQLVRRGTGNGCVAQRSRLQTCAAAGFWFEPGPSGRCGATERFAWRAEAQEPQMEREPGGGPPARDGAMRIRPYAWTTESWLEENAAAAFLEAQLEIIGAGEDLRHRRDVASTAAGQATLDAARLSSAAARAAEAAWRFHLIAEGHLEAEADALDVANPDRPLPAPPRPPPGTSMEDGSRESSSPTSSGPRPAQDSVVAAVPNRSAAV